MPTGPFLRCRPSIFSVAAELFLGCRLSHFSLLTLPFLLLTLGCRLSSFTCRLSLRPLANVSVCFHRLPHASTCFHVLPYCISVFESSDNFCLALLVCLRRELTWLEPSRAKQQSAPWRLLAATFQCDFSVVTHLQQFSIVLKRHELLLTMFQIHLILVYSCIFWCILSYIPI